MHSKLLGGGESARARAVMMMDCSLLVFPLSQYTASKCANLVGVRKKFASRHLNTFLLRAVSDATNEID
jgi:hypothetical protein